MSCRVKARAEAAERRVHALAPYPHRVDEHLGRAALEPVLAEHADRSVEGGVGVELA